MRIVVTGGTGFVGGHVIEQALAAGHRVTALRRPGSRPGRVLAAQPDWVEGPLEGNWRRALAGHDVLLHLAAHTANPPYDTLEACLHWNVTVPLGLAAQAHEAGIERFVIAGSCFEYGPVASGRVAVDAPLAPTSSYAISKAAASVAFLGQARLLGLRTTLMRLFHVYGPGEPEGRLWPSLRRAALAGEDFPMSPGHQVRDFVAVEEAARQLLAAAVADDAAPGLPQVRHVGTGRAQTLLQFAEHWWQHWGARGRLLPGALPYRPGEAMVLVPEIEPR